ncbi:MAG: hypothetical protein FWF28_07505 [Micrococcales bacterium]|nr:hypothetical protein [Micrococcales bacterium]
MGWAEIALAVLVVAGLVVWFVWVDASRLDRMHRRVDASRSVLDQQLVRRASLAAELATSGVLDPASSIVVGEAAWAALSAGGDPGPAGVVADLRRVLVDAPVWPADQEGTDRGQLESELTAALREVLADPHEVALMVADEAGSELLDELAAAWYRLQLARRFHNDAVTLARGARRAPLVRLLRLAGSAPEPVTVELDDGWPEGLRGVLPHG